MPVAKKTTSTKTAKKAATPAVETPATVAPATETPETVPETTETKETPNDASEEKKTVRRTAVTLEDICLQLETMEKLILEEIEKRREATDKNGNRGIKFLRTLNKNVKQVHQKVKRFKNKKNRVKRTGETKSGFMMPMKISDEMCKFAGWTNNEPKSRVDVTKTLCAYIKEHDLQDPKDRRKIKPDEALAKLLSYTPDSKPLTYFRLQQLIQPHFPKKASAAPAQLEAPPAAVATA